MSTEVHFRESIACATCGKFGAYEFDGLHLCDDCYAQRGSCCAEFSGNDLTACPPESAPAVAEPIRDSTGALADERLKVGINCCYQSCRGCSAIKKLRAFRGRHPHDWQTRLHGSERSVLAALFSQ